jgi:hypothetical protein
MTPNPADDKFATFSCPYCGQRIEFPAIMAHEATPCPTCNETLKLPANEYWPGPVGAEKQLIRIAQCESNYTSGMTDEALFDFPCWEYVSLYSNEASIDWLGRWQKAGGPPCVNSRFIAPKTHAVWKNLGDPRMFPDALGNPFPPYVNGSGFTIIECNRKECINLGVIDENVGVKAHNDSLLREMFDKEPSKVTPSELAAKKQDLIEALAMLKASSSHNRK